jgi:2-polyprenyl-6-methoxyphenol hydroxylase-like FAD-dependent oxidoreductase
LSIEDAVELAWAIRRNSTIPAAVAAFEVHRRRRVEPIVRRASRMNSSKVPGPVGRSIRDAVMPIAMRMMTTSKTVRKQLDRQYGYHLEPLTGTVPAPSGADAEGATDQ